jgi:hypothetical protein
MSLDNEEEETRNGSTVRLKLDPTIPELALEGLRKISVNMADFCVRCFESRYV